MYIYIFVFTFFSFFCDESIERNDCCVNYCTRYYSVTKQQKFRISILIDSVLCPTTKYMVIEMQRQWFTVALCNGTF